MGCNFCDDCKDCTVGEGLDCGSWEPAYEDGRLDQDDDRYSDDEVRSYDDGFRENNSGIDNGLHCVSCGASIRLGWKYCLRCGESIPKKYCVSCGSVVADDWDYCPKCGSSIPESSYEITPASYISTPDTSIIGAASSAYDDDIPF